MTDQPMRDIINNKRKQCLVNRKQYSLPTSWFVKDIITTSTLKGRIGWQGLTTTEYLRNGEFSLITGTDFKDGKIDWNTCFFVSKKRYSQDENIQVRVGDILITKDGTIGKVAFIDKLPKAATLNSGIFVLRPKNGVYVPNFMYFVLTSGIFGDFIENLKAGSTIAHLYQKDFNYFEFPIPDQEEEQNKIAVVLRNADSLIEKTKEVINKYTNIKNGLMHDFFGNDDNKVANPKFLAVSLGDKEYFDLVTGGTPSTNITEYWGGAIKWMNSGDVHKKIIFDVEGRITDKGYKHSNATLVPIDSILIALAGQGKTRGTVAINKTELTTNQSVAALIPKKRKICPQYLYYYLDSKYLELRSISAGSGRAGLNLAILGKYVIRINRQKCEQMKIALILDNVDEVLGTETFYLNKLERIKLGLMQDLLTGRIRMAA